MKRSVAGVKYGVPPKSAAASPAGAVSTPSVGTALDPFDLLARARLSLATWKRLSMDARFTAMRKITASDVDATRAVQYVDAAARCYG